MTQMLIIAIALLLAAVIGLVYFWIVRPEKPRSSHSSVDTVSVARDQLWASAREGGRHIR